MYKPAKLTQKWLEKAYPKRASEATGSWIEATEFSLNKFKNLSKEILARHNLQMLSTAIFTLKTDKDGYIHHVLDIDVTTCPLCIRSKHITASPFPISYCLKCPLYKELEEQCDSPNQPWNVWASTGDPQPMIDALQRTLDRLKEEQDEQ